MNRVRITKASTLYIMLLQSLHFIYGHVIVPSCSYVNANSREFEVQNSSIVYSIASYRNFTDIYTKEQAVLTAVKNYSDQYR